MANKVLLRVSSNPLSQGSEKRGQWIPATDDAINGYIKGIETGQIRTDKVETADINNMIGGVPTPWARAKMFMWALRADGGDSKSEDGLQGIYDIMAAEWRGLMALIALYPERVCFSEPIRMNNKVGKGMIYEIIPSFGRMLFEREAKLWEEHASSEDDPQPFIQLIYCKDSDGSKQLVGGTSPYTGCFTGISYNLGSGDKGIPWYSHGRLEDPTLSKSFGKEQLQKLYIFLNHFQESLSEFRQMLYPGQVFENNEDPVNLHLGNSVGKWIDVIKNRWKEEYGGEPGTEGQIAMYSEPIDIYSILFRGKDVPIYMNPDDSSFHWKKEADNYMELGGINGLLSSSQYVVGWMDDEQRTQSLEDAPVFFLKATDASDLNAAGKPRKKYFSIPLSERGLEIFKDYMGGLLGYNTTGSSSLKADIVGGDKLKVTLTVIIGSQTATISREYTIDMFDYHNYPGTVVLWPNFIAKDWKKYYLYSEFTNDTDLQFAPFFYRWKSEGRTELVRYGDEATELNRGKLYVYSPQAEPMRELKVEVPLKYPGAKDGITTKYEILSSKLPVAGLSAFVRGKGGNGEKKHAGFLVVRNEKGRVENLSSQQRGRVVVGFDFGSNNTCVYYKDADDVYGGKAIPVRFGGCRSVLVGMENDRDTAQAEKNELLFLSAYPCSIPKEKINGQIKSWLHKHDPLYNADAEKDDIANGIPVNRPNIKVIKMERDQITTDAGRLYCNMKWLEDNEKYYFIHEVWLQVAADLFRQNKYATSIQWSYPSSMMAYDKRELKNAFEELKDEKKTPLDDSLLPRDISSTGITEADAVCHYATSLNEDIGSRTLFLGIDVGGSTSDIFIMDNETQRDHKPLVENSVRVSAGAFVEAVSSSTAFQQALVKFHEAGQTGVYVEGIKDIDDNRDKAPFYLNSIFDQLSTSDEFKAFYSSMWRNAKFVFTIPAYVTGLLLFYSGILMGKSVTAKEKEVDSVKILPFGKGGRLFHWLPNALGKDVANEYYSKCLRSGLALWGIEIADIDYMEGIEGSSKSEVAMGLCSFSEGASGSGREVDNPVICGEKGVTICGKTAGSDEEDVDEDGILASVSGDWFADMTNLEFSSTEVFEDFLSVFLDFACNETRLLDSATVQQIKAEVTTMTTRLKSFVRGDSEYRKAGRRHALSKEAFEYAQPIIMIEGAYFLDEILNRKVFN